jgi:hypothetical protein
MAVVIKQVLVSLILSYAFVNALNLSSAVVLWTLGVSFIVIFGSFNTCWVTLPGKNPLTGEIPIIRVLIFFPYFVAVMFLMIGGKTISLFKRWNSYDEIYTSVYLGDYYSSFMSKHKWASIVDVTNELPRLGLSKNYLNVPSWDGCPPPVQYIEKAVDFILSCEKPVLIHCA